MKFSFIGVLLAAGGAVAFGISNSIGPITYGMGSNLWTLLFLNNLFAIPCLWLLLRCRGIPLRCSSRAGLWSALLLGVLGHAGTCLTLNLAFIMVGVGIGGMLHMTHTLFSAVGESVLQGTRLTAANYIAILLVLVGAGCMAADSAAAEFSPGGFLIAVLSGALYASQLLGLAHSPAGREPPLRVLFYMIVSATAVFALVVLLTGQLAIRTMSPAAIAVNGVCSVLTNIVGFSFVQLSLRRVDAAWVSILGALESVTCAVLGLILFREGLPPAKAIGCIFIIFSAALPPSLELLKKRRP